MQSRILPILAILLPFACAHAADFTVTSTADVVDANPGDGVCATASSGCTLRAAVQEANALAGPDTISVPAGTYVLSLGGAEPAEPAAAGDLDVTDAVTITGAGPAATIVDASGVGRVFEVSSTTTLSDLTIRGGQDAFGGAILASSPTAGFTLTVQDAQITANQGVDGGALYVDGIDAPATVVLERVSVTGNQASRGGAIASTDQTTVTFRNVTVSGNVSGAGEHQVVAGDTLLLDHVTIVGATIGGSGDIPAGTITIRNSILDDGPSGNVCAEGTFVSQGGNLEHGTSCGFAAPGDVGGADPALGPLQDNGGGTLTHAIAATSPAVDAAGSCPPPNVDQRGEPRPIDGNGDQVAACDAGAFELAPGVVTTTTTTTLPNACGPEASFTAVRCRLGALSDRVSVAAAPGKVETTIVALLGKASARVTAAESATSARKTRKLLRKAAALVKKAFKKMGTKGGRAALPDVTVRAALQFEADAIRTTVLALAG